MRLLLVIGSVLWTAGSCFGQLDSLQQAYQTATLDSVRMEILNELIAYTAYNDTEAAIGYGLAFDSIALKTGNEERIAHGKKILGICYYVAEEYDKAIDLYLAALKSYEKLRDTFDIGMIYNNIGSVYDVQNDPEQSLKYFNQAKDWFDQTDDLEWQALIRQNLATQYDKVEQLDTALALYEEALALYERPEVRKTAYKPLYNGRLATLLNNLSRLYANLGYSEKAIQAGERALSLTDVELDPYTLMQVKNALGVAYGAEGQLKRGIENFKESLSLSRSVENRIMAGNNLLKLSGLLAESGDFEEAFARQSEYIGLMDSLYNLRKEEKMNELIARFETKKKEQEISLLQKSNEIKDLRIAKSRRGQWFLISGLVVVITGLGIITYFFRANQRKNAELADKNRIINEALEEKEALLREIHHRVKNNLQIISSLLSLQERRLKGEEGTAALQESRNRVQAMALIHQNLYQQEDIGKINISEYMARLSQQVASSFKLNQQDITLELDVDPIYLDVDSVIPLALITNELLTNAYKYAFRDQKQGTIGVAFKKMENDLFELRISDDGIGMPREFADGNGNSFGMKLIRTFARKMKSGLTIEHQKGTTVAMAIPGPQLNLVA